MVDKIEVDESGVVRLVLFSGPTPVGMSTHELKAYAHDQFFGQTLEKAKRISEEGYDSFAEELADDIILNLQFN